MDRIRRRRIIYFFLDRRGKRESLSKELYPEKIFFFINNFSQPIFFFFFLSQHWIPPVFSRNDDSIRFTDRLAFIRGRREGEMFSRSWHFYRSRAWIKEVVSGKFTRRGIKRFAGQSTLCLVKGKKRKKKVRLASKLSCPFSAWIYLSGGV